VGALTDPDAFYSELVGLYEGLDAGQTLRLTAQLLLRMAEHVGDEAVLRSVLREAAANFDANDSKPS
jgi:hypothetical protein